ncbi:hypothetical protein BH09BAC5_BH09BAC5_17870 [soil metagenome]
MKEFISSKIILLLFFPVLLSAQSKSKSFAALSAPEKCWVMAHPFVAKKAFNCTQLARKVTDSLSVNGILKDGNGGQLDAFRHAFWMSLLVQKMSAHKAEKLGKAHERGNYKDWKKGKEEDNSRADSIMCVMDLYNNTTGIEIGKSYAADTNSSKKSLTETILLNVRNGKMVMTKKNAEGFFLDVSGRIIVIAEYDGKWFIPKCIVPSDYKMPNATNEGN